MTSSGVPVGDTTLLQRLRQALEYEDPWTPRDVLGLARVNDVDFICDALNALPAVVTLIEAAQPFSDCVTCLEEDCPHKVCVLNRALAPFVGEATQ